MKPDLDKYLPMLDGAKLTEEEKADMIRALWSVMDALTDRTFGLHPAQQLPLHALRKFADDKDALVESQDMLREDFGQARLGITHAPISKHEKDNT